MGATPLLRRPCLLGTSSYQTQLHAFPFSFMDTAHVYVTSPSIKKGTATSSPRSCFLFTLSWFAFFHCHISQNHNRIIHENFYSLTTHPPATWPSHQPFSNDRSCHIPAPSSSILDPHFQQQGLYCSFLLQVYCSLTDFLLSSFSLKIIYHCITREVPS